MLLGLDFGESHRWRPEKETFAGHAAEVYADVLAPSTDCRFVHCAPCLCSNDMFIVLLSGLCNIYLWKSYRCEKGLRFLRRVSSLFVLSLSAHRLVGENASRGMD